MHKLTLSLLTSLLFLSILVIAIGFYLVRRNSVLTGDYKFQAEAIVSGKVVPIDRHGPGLIFRSDGSYINDNRDGLPPGHYQIHGNKVVLTRGDGLLQGHFEGNTIVLEYDLNDPLLPQQMKESLERTHPNVWLIKQSNT